MLRINTSNKRILLPEYDNESLSSKSSIFLAGPTRRGSYFEASWRYEACDILNKLSYKGVVYIPEYPKDCPWNDTNIEKQTRWEWEALENASCICFWIPRDHDDLIGLTTNVEFGRYITMKPDSVVLGYPKEAFRMRYLDMLYRECTDRTPVNTLQETLALAVERAVANVK